MLLIEEGKVLLTSAVVIPWFVPDDACTSCDLLTKGDMLASNKLATRL